MTGYGRHGDRRRDPDKDQKRCHQKSAADPEHSGDIADRQPHPQHQEDVHRQISNGKIDLQALFVRRVGARYATSTPGPLIMQLALRHRNASSMMRDRSKQVVRVVLGLAEEAVSDHALLQFDAAIRAFLKRPR